MQRILPVTPYKLCSTVWEPLWDLCWRSQMGNEWFCRVWIIVHFFPRANISWVNSSRVCSCLWQGNHSLPCGRCLERGVVLRDPDGSGTVYWWERELNIWGPLWCFQRDRYFKSSRKSCKQRAVPCIYESGGVAEVPLGRTRLQGMQGLFSIWAGAELDAEILDTAI